MRRWWRVAAQKYGEAGENNSLINNLLFPLSLFVPNLSSPKCWIWFCKTNHLGSDQKEDYPLKYPRDRDYPRAYPFNYRDIEECLYFRHNIMIINVLDNKLRWSKVGYKNWYRYVI